MLLLMTQIRGRGKRKIICSSVLSQSLPSINAEEPQISLNVETSKISEDKYKEYSTLIS
jgi:hypothetical protein